MNLSNRTQSLVNTIPSFSASVPSLNPYKFANISWKTPNITLQEGPNPSQVLIIISFVWENSLSLYIYMLHDKGPPWPRPIRPNP